MTDILQNQVVYKANFLTRKEADFYFKHFLKNVKWQNDRIQLFGKTIIPKRKMAWYGDKGKTYTYSNDTKLPEPWFAELYDLKIKVETATNHSFNSCLLNYYHNGKEYMSWHSDNEKELGKNPCIASVSLGAERDFVFKHNESKTKHTICLEHGSLLVMQEDIQEKWKHSLPKRLKVHLPRINLTFRRIIS